MENISELKRRADVLKGFSNPVRLCIISGLLEKERCNVSAMEKCLSVSQSSISQHLAKLKSVGIITDEKKKNEVYYSLKNEEIKTLAKAILGGKI